ncbi:MAG: thiolase family protein [Burkholderiaceae bacterium]
MTEIAIPYGAYWSTPFARWQGALAHLHSVRFAAHVTTQALARRGLAVEAFDYGVLGITVPQRASFYGLPWLAGMIGAPSLAGPTISQACATGARVLRAAASEIIEGAATTALVVTTDRTSNGPHLYYPAPDGPGGTGEHENWILDNFERDPWADLAMVDTADRVAARHGISTARQHDVVLERYAQYSEAVANDSAFLKRFMDLPFEVPDARMKRVRTTLAGDEGIHPTSADKLAKLSPVRQDGSVTFGGQTHPADGSAGIVVTTPHRARELSSNPSIAIRILAFGQSRVEKGYMPEAPVPAARQALERAGLSIADIDVIKTHNPFVVNDIVLADAFGIPTHRMNRFGCSLVWGHPQAPTGLRAIIELIEELAMRGGGQGLFTGCAAGDTGMAVVIRVGDGA